MAALTPDERLDLQRKLKEAEDARHLWQIGQTSASWTYRGRTIQYSVEGMKHIDRYIAELRRRLAGSRAVRTLVTYGVPD